MRLQAAHPPLEDNHMNVFGEIVRRCAAMTAQMGELTALDGLVERADLGRAEAVNSFGIDHRSVGENLEKHPELAAVIGPAKCHPGDQRIGRGDCACHPRPGRQVHGGVR